MQIFKGILFFKATNFESHKRCIVCNLEEKDSLKDLHSVFCLMKKRSVQPFVFLILDQQLISRATELYDTCMFTFMC